MFDYIKENYKKMAIPAGILAVLISSIFIVIFQVKEYYVIQGKIANTVMEIQKANLVINSREREIKKIQNAVFELENLNKNISVKVENGDALVQLAEAAEREGVSIKKIEPGQVISQKYYSALPVSLTIRGDSRKVFNYLSRVEEGKAVDSFTEIKVLSIVPYVKENEDITRDEVVADFMLIIYSRQHIIK